MSHLSNLHAVLNYLGIINAGINVQSIKGNFTRPNILRCLDPIIRVQQAYICGECTVYIACRHHDDTCTKLTQMYDSIMLVLLHLVHMTALCCFKQTPDRLSER